MKLRFLGNTGVKVSEICFGAMTFGGKGYWKYIGQLEQREANDLVSSMKKKDLILLRSWKK